MRSMLSSVIAFARRLIGRARGAERNFQTVKAEIFSAPTSTPGFFPQLGISQTTAPPSVGPATTTLESTLMITPTFSGVYSALSDTNGSNSGRLASTATGPTTKPPCEPTTDPSSSESDPSELRAYVGQ